ELIAGKTWLRSEQLRKLAEDDIRLRHRRGDRRFVGGDAEKPAANDPMEYNDVGDALKQVPIVDVHHLIHARRCFGISRRQRWPRKYPVDVAQDRLCLVEPEAIMLAAGILPKGCRERCGSLLMPAGASGDSR